MAGGYSIARSEYDAPTMFALAPRVAWTVTAVAALLAGAAVAVAVAPIEPSLAWHLTPISTTRDNQVFELRAEPRGGETIPHVRLEIVSGRVGVLGRLQFFQLSPGTAARFTLHIERSAAEDPVVRLHQNGRVNRTYDIPLPVDRR